LSPEFVPTVAAALSRLPVPPITARMWQQFDLTCPTNPSHRVQPWNAPGRCPRCKAYLERGALPYRVWD
jgi:hypothetical protein